MGVTLDRILKLKDTGEARRIRVLDAKNDPWWATPARIRNAKWIAGIWHERINKKTYCRGLHYRILSYNLECPWGQNRKVHPSPIYMNVDSDFNALCQAVRDARSWGLVPWTSIEDRKHKGIRRWVDWGQSAGNRQVRPFENFEGSISYDLTTRIPKVEEIEEAYIEDYDEDFNDIVERIIKTTIGDYMTGLTSTRYQPYYLAIISEKSGIEGILKTCRDRLDYGFDFLNFEGQASATLIRAFVYNRLFKKVPYEHPVARKRIRLFYISDYDYAGRTMVPAFIQKLIYYLWENPRPIDIKIKPLALTRETVEKYDLPPGPVPARSLGAKTLQDRWLRDFGRIIELDSLMELHPGALETIVEEELARYIDPTLEAWIDEKLDAIGEDASSAIRDALEDLRSDWEDTKQRLVEAMDAMNEAIDRMNVNEALRKLKAEIEKLKDEHDIESLIEEFEETLKDIDVDFKPPDLKIESDFEADEGDDWLYDSNRNRMIQAERLREYRP